MNGNEVEIADNIEQVKGNLAQAACFRKEYVELLFNRFKFFLSLTYVMFSWKKNTFVMPNIADS